MVNVLQRCCFLLLDIQTHFLYNSRYCVRNWMQKPTTKLLSGSFKKYRGLIQILFWSIIEIVLVKLLHPVSVLGCTLDLRLDPNLRLHPNLHFCTCGIGTRSTRCWMLHFETPPSFVRCETWHALRIRVGQYESVIIKTNRQTSRPNIYRDWVKPKNQAAPNEVGNCKQFMLPATLDLVGTSNSNLMTLL